MVECHTYAYIRVGFHYQLDGGLGLGLGSCPNDDFIGGMQLHHPKPQTLNPKPLFGLGTAPLSNSWIIFIIWLYIYIAFNRTLI